MPGNFRAPPRPRILKFALAQRWPAVGIASAAEEGASLGYGPVTRALYRRAASYVDRILKGTKPADLPIQQTTKVELIVNLKTAKALGLDVPATLLARADEVIE